MDKVFIKDLMVRGIIGISEKERSQPQDIVVNVTLYTDISEGSSSDNINDCVNYRTVAKAIIAHIQNVSRYTVEALAEDITDICLKTPKVEKVKIKVEKPGAVRFSKSVGVEIIRKK
ncbi:MAG: dihydroneopterin aldolase [Pelolinea sp.]|nr:dihydroneopterin aldolase [Pelolinea sp.]